MLIFYVDEFGDRSLALAAGTQPPALKAGVSPYFVLAAVGIRDTSRKPLAEALLALKQRHFGTELLPWNASEIKGRYLFRLARSVASGHVASSPAAYAALDSVAKADQLIDDIGRIFFRFRPLIFAIAVDKAALLALKTQPPRDPLGVCYTYLSQRVALTMDRLHAGEAAILVADQQTEHESYFRSGRMHETRASMTLPLPVQPNFNVVLDKPLWIDTDLSEWDREILQLPDIVPYSVGEVLKRGCAPVEPCYLWSRIKPHFAVQWSSGAIESGGLAIHPRPAAYPQL